MTMKSSILIVGLGNPGSRYEYTRHNIGFRIVKALAAKHQILLKSALVKTKGSLGEGEIKDCKVQLLLPLTYMNESGAAVKKCLDYYKIPLDQLIVIADDSDLPFGAIRLRPQGGTGGHNGLKSIEAHLGTQAYARMRIGIGSSKGELTEYVLRNFSDEEEAALPQIVDRAIQGLETWILEGIEAAMQKTNRAGDM